MIRHFLNLRQEILRKFRGRNSADTTVLIIKGNILEIVKIRKKRNLVKLSYSCDENESYVIILFFSSPK